MLAMVLELATVLVKWSGMAASPVVPAAAAASGKCTGRHCSTFDVNCRYFFSPRCAEDTVEDGLLLTSLLL